MLKLSELSNLSTIENNPLVTVVITVFNNPLTEIQFCINSIITQSYRTIEIILVDDGSNEKYKLELKKTLKVYPNVLYFRKPNGGLASARNYGIKKSNGEFISFIDPDDTYHKDKLLIQTKLLIPKKNAFAVAGGSYTTTTKNNGIVTKQKKMPLVIDGNCFPLILENFLGIHGTPNYLFRKSHILSNNMYDERLIVHQDRDLLYRLSKNHELVTHQDIVCYVNKQKTSSSFNPTRKKLEAKLIFINKIINDNDLNDDIVITKYMHKYLMIRLILSENYSELISSINNHYRQKLNYKSGLNNYFKSLILISLFSRFGSFIYFILRQKNIRLINRINYNQIES